MSKQVLFVLLWANFPAQFSKRINIYNSQFKWADGQSILAYGLYLIFNVNPDANRQDKAIKLIRMDGKSVLRNY